MYIDLQEQLSAAQAFTGAATLSTNKKDFGDVTPKRQVGTGEPIGVAINIDVAAGAGSTHTWELLQSADAAIGTPDIIASITMLAADLPLGKRIFLPIPPGFPTKEFLALRNTATGGTTTVTASASLMSQSMFESWVAYAKNYTITG
jgi:Bbp16-like protein